MNTLADVVKSKMNTRDELVNDFLEKIKNKSAVIGIVGLGYVGVPLALTFLKAGFKVIGFDTDSAKVRNIGNGVSYFKHIKSEELEPYAKSYQLSSTTNFEVIKEVDAIIVCVPTPITEHKDPDMSFIEGATKAVAEHMRDGQLFVLESTTYPGTTDEVVAKIIHDIREVGGRRFSVDENYFLAFSPEREDPGNKNFNTKTIPKVVGGATEHSLIVAKALYAAALDHVVPVSSTRVAELTKIFENTYRSVNIALVNELKMLCDRLNINVWEVIDAAKTKPFGFQAFYPGPGVGGHCIFVDPYYFSWKVRATDKVARFIELAGEINDSMPEYVFQKTQGALNTKKKSVNGSVILVVGVAYKRDIEDTRESPAYNIVRKLMDVGATVQFYDPYVSKFGSSHYSLLRLIDLTKETISKYDCVIIHTDHSCIDYNMIAEHAQLVVDTRNVVPRTFGNVVQA